MPENAVLNLKIISSDPKWERRRRVIEALEAYKLRRDEKLALRQRYEAVCSQLYSGRSSRITGMPINHDQFTAQDHFAEMLDEKLELEKALADDEEDEVARALGLLDKRDCDVIEKFFLGDKPQKATYYLCAAYSLSSTQIYRIRDIALDELSKTLDF